MKKGKSFENMWYYAHSMQIYNTATERKELTFLRTVFPNQILCPNNDVGELGNMYSYLTIVRKSFGVICSEHKGYLAKGTFQETQLSLSLNNPTFVIRNNQLFRVGEVKVHDPNDYKFKYGKVVLFKATVKKSEIKEKEYEPFTVWTTADNNSIPINEMTDRHINNVLRLFHEGILKYDAEQWIHTFEKELTARQAIKVNQADNGRKNELPF